MIRMWSPGARELLAAAVAGTGDAVRTVLATLDQPVVLANDNAPGQVVVSGDKAGLTWSILPAESRRPGAICIDMGWLKRNWDDWFAYQWGGAMRVIDIARAEILEWDRRMIVETP